MQNRRARGLRRKRVFIDPKWASFDIFDNRSNVTDASSDSVSTKTAKSQSKKESKEKAQEKKTN